MDREIIETKLVRLFSSGKDDDFTKIGRFGIGFVSVFAIEPQVVCLDTGRAGEYWRVLFKPDRTFDLIALADPVEGTQIRIFKPASANEAKAFEARAREVVSYWCKHVSVPIRVSGELLNEGFSIESICQVSYEEEGTRMVAGWVRPDHAVGGFFNRGLTLKDGEPSPWPCVAFKIDSRYLEHTLTRDQVLKDGHYQKAYDLLERVITQDLVEALLARMQQLAASPKRLHDWVHIAALMTGWLERWGHITGTERERRAIIPTMYGEPVSVKQLRRAHERGEVMITWSRTLLTDALQERAMVLEVPLEHRAAFEAFYVQVCGGPPTVLHAVWTMPVLDARDRAPGAERLKDEVRLALKALGARVEHVHLVGVIGDESTRSRAMVCPEALNEPMRWSAWPEASRGELLSARRVGLLHGYPLWDSALELARKEPEWAALLVVKALLLQDSQGMQGKDEGIVTAHMVNRRQARLEQEGN
jgi:molecular chaperone HtpG